MREATGGSLLLYLVIFFVGVIILFFASIMSYAKAYRVKNRIINIVEETDCSLNFNNTVKENIITAIDTDLQTVGYNYSNAKQCNFNNKDNASCENFNISSVKGGNYNYCICRVDVDSGDDSRGYFYEVITFTQFEFPIIKDVISSEVHGESKLMCKDYSDYDYEYEEG